MPAAETKLARVTAEYRRRDAAVTDARTELLAAMAEARAAGLSLARIAEIVGMSCQRVMELLEREWLHGE